MLDRSACACAAKTAAADSARCGNRRPANAKLLSGASWTPKTGHSSALLASCGASLSTAGTSSARSAFCTNFRSFAAPPPYESIACAERRFHTCRPRSERNFSTDGQEAHSKLKKEVKKGSEKCANGPVDHTCNASGHWACLWECSHWSWHSTCCCSVTAAGLMRPYTCTWLDLPSPCRPLLLPSPLRPPGTRARAYPRRLYEPWL